MESGSRIIYNKFRKIIIAELRYSYRYFFFFHSRLNNNDDNNINFDMEKINLLKAKIL